MSPVPRAPAAEVRFALSKEPLNTIFSSGCALPIAVSSPGYGAADVLALERAGPGDQEEPLRVEDPHRRPPFPGFAGPPRALCRIAAAMNAAKRGWARLGFDWNSGWNWTARNHGWPFSSMISTRLRLGLMPLTTSAFLRRLEVRVVDLVAVAVALADQRRAVGLRRERPGHERAVVAAEPHRRALVGDGLLLLHHVDDGIRAPRVELGAVGAREPEDVARDLDDRDLQAEAQAEIRDRPSPGRSAPRRSCPRCRGRRSRPGPGCRRGPSGAPCRPSSPGPRRRSCAR